MAALDGRRGRRAVAVKRWVLVALALVWLAAMLLCAAALLWWQQSLRQPLELPPEGLVYSLEPGQSLQQMLRALQQRGVLGPLQPEAIRLHARLAGRGQRIHAGEYRLAPGLNALTLLEQLERGEVIQYRFTIVEGWTVAQTLAALRARSELEQRLEEGVDATTLLTHLNGESQGHAEGWLYPDTYRFVRGSSDVELLRRAHRRMREVVAEEWANRAPGLPYANPGEALIMASIIERETAVAAERGAIAGVFVRRLERGMRLQTDPATIYGLGERYEGRLQRRHLRDALNPYNTYRHAGLPPTPIALPGRAAIHAALHPEPGTALYFVARGDGTHAFSSTLAEHEAAVRRYQLRRRPDYRSTPLPVPP